MIAFIDILPLNSFAVNNGVGNLGGNTTPASSDGISPVLGKITCALKGSWGKAIATVAVVVLGIGLFLGKLSWGLAVATAIGIGLIFSAGTVVTWLGGGSAIVC